MTITNTTTALDLIDELTDVCARKVIEVNQGRTLTKAQFAAALERTFEIALTKVMEGLETEAPELAERFRIAFLTEYENAYGPQE